LLENYQFDIGEFQREMGAQSPWTQGANQAASAVANSPVASIRTVDVARILLDRLHAVLKRIVLSGLSYFYR
jgi:hypothetical protein